MKRIESEQYKKAIGLPEDYNWQEDLEKDERIPGLGKNRLQRYFNSGDKPKENTPKWKNLKVVYKFPNGFMTEAMDTFNLLLFEGFHPSWGKMEDGGRSILIPVSEVLTLRRLQEDYPSRYGNANEY